MGRLTTLSLKIAKSILQLIGLFYSLVFILNMLAPNIGDVSESVTSLASPSSASLATIVLREGRESLLRQVCREQVFVTPQKIAPVDTRLVKYKVFDAPCGSFRSSTGQSRIVLNWLDDRSLRIKFPLNERSTGSDFWIDHLDYSKTVSIIYDPEK